MTSNFPLLINLFVGTTMIAGGYLIARKPSLLSNYSQFSEDERHSEAFRHYLLSVRKSMIMAALAIIFLSLSGTIFQIDALYYIGLLVPVIALTFYISLIQGRVSKQQKRKSYKSMIIIAVLTLIMGITPMIGNYSSIRYEAGVLYIKGMYGEELKREEIRSVRLTGQVPCIDWKVNGYALGNTRLGYFKTCDNQTVKLLLRSAKPPFLHIVTTNGKHIYINSKQEREINQLYHTLLQDKQ